jgi:hypothetical protein
LVVVLVVTLTLLHPQHHPEDLVVEVVRKIQLVVLENLEHQEHQVKETLVAAELEATLEDIMAVVVVVLMRLEQMQLLVLLDLVVLVLLLILMEQHIIMQLAVAVLVLEVQAPEEGQVVLVGEEEERDLQRDLVDRLEYSLDLLVEQDQIQVGVLGVIAQEVVVVVVYTHLDLEETVVPE